MILAIFILAQATAGDAARLVAEARAATRAVVECRGERAGDEIVVCARRDADRWRVPFVPLDPGDPKLQDVPAERARLVTLPNNCAEMRLMAYGCGVFGVSVTSGGRGTSVGAPRPLAP